MLLWIVLGMCVLIYCGICLYRFSVFIVFGMVWVWFSVSSWVLICVVCWLSWWMCCSVLCIVFGLLCVSVWFMCRVMLVNGECSWCVVLVMKWFCRVIIFVWCVNRLLMVLISGWIFLGMLVLEIGVSLSWCCVRWVFSGVRMCRLWVILN